MRRIAQARTTGGLALLLKAQNLATCATPSVGAHPFIESSETIPLATIHDTLKKAKSLDKVAASTLATDITAQVEPHIFAFGEPDHAVKAHLTLLDSVRKSGILPFDGTLDTGYAIAEWLHHHATSTLTLQTTTPEGTTTTQPLDALDGRILEGSTSVLTPIDTLHAHTYTLTLQTTDDQDQTTTDTATFVSDAFAPTITTTTTIPTYTNQEYLSLEWIITEDATTIDTITLLQLDGENGDEGATILTPTITHTPGTSTWTATITLDLTTTPHAGVTWLRLTATDTAGHESVQQNSITRDLQAPDLTSTIQDLIDNDYITTPTLTATTTATDDVSHIKTLKIWIHNTTDNTDTTLYDQTNLDLDSYTNTWNHDTWPKSTYDVHITATDHVGNTATHTVSAYIMAHPNLKNIIPEYTEQESEPALYLNATTKLDHWPNLHIDDATIRILDTDGTTLHEYSNGTTLGEYDTSWTATTSGTVTIQYEADMGRATTLITLNVDITQLQNGAYDWNLDPRYGQLSTTTDHDLYRFTTPTLCNDQFTVTVTGYGHNMDLYIQQGDPSTHGSDPNNYEKAPEADTESYTWTNAQTGQTYALMIRHQNTDTKYLLSYKSCDDEPEPDRPLPDLQNV